MARARSATVQRRRRALGARIRALRHAQGWSQEVLADRASLHRTYVSSVELGERNISMDNLYAVADALHVQVRELFDSEHSR